MYLGLGVHCQRNRKWGCAVAVRGVASQVIRVSREAATKLENKELDGQAYVVQ